MLGREGGSVVVLGREGGRECCCVREGGRERGREGVLLR